MLTSAPIRTIEGRTADERGISEMGLKWDRT
jgi:hypothetical protein